MIVGKKYLFLERLRDTGHTWDEVKDCVISDDGETVKVDDMHPSYPRERKEGHQPPKSGVGTAMKRLLGGVGLAAGAGCKCKERATLMDQHSVEWNIRNRQVVVGWLREEAEYRKLPFWGPGAMLLFWISVALSPLWANRK